MFSTTTAAKKYLAVYKAGNPFTRFWKDQSTPLNPENHQFYLCHKSQKASLRVKIIGPEFLVQQTSVDSASPPLRHVFGAVLPLRLAEMGPATRYTLRRNTASIMKI